LLLASAPVLGACSKSKDESPAKRTEVKVETPTADAAAKELREPSRSASCSSVLATKRAKSAKTTLALTAGDDAIPIAVDSNAVYAPSAVWTSGDAPAVCGLVQKSAGEASMILIAQFHQRGDPVFRLQMTDVQGGDHAIDKMPGAIVGVFEREGAPRGSVALNFEQGAISISPSPLTAGTIEVEVDAKGKLIGHGAPVPFALKGTFAAELEEQQLP
jgi:hypothetical protein